MWNPFYKSGVVGSGSRGRACKRPAQGSTGLFDLLEESGSPSRVFVMQAQASFPGGGCVLEACAGVAGVAVTWLSRVTSMLCYLRLELEPLVHVLQVRADQRIPDLWACELSPPGTGNATVRLCCAAASVCPHRFA